MYVLKGSFCGGHFKSVGSFVEVTTPFAQHFYDLCHLVLWRIIVIEKGLFHDFMPNRAHESKLWPWSALLINSFLTDKKNG